MMPYSPHVSVIIPTHNRSKLLRAAVESVLAQTYPNVEIIVVDDGSTDNTAPVMAQYAGRVNYLQQANQGVAAARNTGFRAASGQYLTFLDDDDLILPAKIERQVQVLASRPEAGLVHCRYYYADQDGNLLDKVGLLPEGEVLKDLLCGNFIWLGAPLIRRQCLEQVGLFDESIPSVSADWDLWLRVALAGIPFACVQEPLGAYRTQRDSMLADAANLERATLAVFDKVFANPLLPTDAVDVKAQALGMWRFWISCRYYAAHRWDDARRNLSEALALRPYLLAEPANLVKLFSDDALSPRVGDPFAFLTGVLDHLPPEAEGLRHYCPQLLSRVYVGLALRNYGLGNLAEARDQLAQAVVLNPAMLEQLEEFAESLYTCAMRLPVSTPLSYAEMVLQNLPPEAQRLGRVRARVLSDVNVGCAFEDYSAGRRLPTVRRVLAALRYRPSWLRNRGVVSIFLRSLLGLAARQHSPS